MDDLHKDFVLDCIDLARHRIQINRELDSKWKVETIGGSIFFTNNYAQALLLGFEYLLLSTKGISACMTNPVVVEVPWRQKLGEISLKCIDNKDLQEYLDVSAEYLVVGIRNYLSKEWLVIKDNYGQELIVSASRFEVPQVIKEYQTNTNKMYTRSVENRQNEYWKGFFSEEKGTLSMVFIELESALEALEGV